MAWDDAAPTQSELSQSPGWDSAPPSNDELAKVSGGKSWLDTSLPFGTSPRGLIKGATGLLPTAGMIGGGLAGEGVASVPLAGAGYAAGKEAEDFINNRVLGEAPQSAAPLDVAKRVAGNTVTGAAYDMGGKVIGKGLGMAADTPAGQFVLKKAGKAATTVASAFSGIPQKELETYAANPAEINAIAKSSGYNSQKMADDLRTEINTKIQSTKSALNNQISQSFATRQGETVESQPIVDALNSAKAKINAKLRPEEISQVDDMISQVNAVSKDGQIPLKDAHDLKELLGEQAKSSYSRNGQIFQNGSKAQMAAKAGSATARSLVNEAAPEIASANDTLSRLHDVEDVMNRNLLAEGKTGASLYSAGSGANEANESALKEIDDITGGNALEGAQKIAAAKTFGKAPLLPVDSTGKTATRVGAAAAAGYLFGGPAGAAAMEGVASPLGIKAAVNAGAIGGKIASGVARNAPSLIGMGAVNAANTVRGGDNEAPTAPQSQPNLTPANGAPSPKGGYDKWANDGFQKLLDHAQGADKKTVQGIKGALMASPQGKKLLISASDLKAGTPAMQSLLTQAKQFGVQK